MGKQEEPHRSVNGWLGSSQVYLEFIYWNYRWSLDRYVEVTLLNLEPDRPFHKIEHSNTVCTFPYSVLCMNHSTCSLNIVPCYKFYTTYSTHLTMTSAGLKKVAVHGLSIPFLAEPVLHVNGVADCLKKLTLSKFGSRHYIRKSFSNCDQLHKATVKSIFSIFLQQSFEPYSNDN